MNEFGINIQKSIDERVNSDIFDKKFVLSITKRIGISSLCSDGMYRIFVYYIQHHTIKKINSITVQLLIKSQLTLRQDTINIYLFPKSFLQFLMCGDYFRREFHIPAEIIMMIHNYIDYEWEFVYRKTPEKITIIDTIGGSESEYEILHNHRGTIYRGVFF